MARNKYPEETIQRILDVSFKLFMEKGYETTSIQDILKELGGLTKGAIYHHFKSKEDILLAVSHRIYSETNAIMQAVVHDTSLNGLQKLQKLFRIALSQVGQEDMMMMAPKLLDNPTFLVLHLRNSIEEAVPQFIKPILEEGIRDGSIQTEYPVELAELLMLLPNMWLNPMIFSTTPTSLLNRCRLFQKLLMGLGLDLFDDGMMACLESYAVLYEKQSEEKYKK